MADAIELTRALIQFDTVNPPGNEAQCAEYLGALLEAADFSLSFYPIGEGRTNLIARIGGADDKRALCFSGHTDVVPLGAAPWTRDPFGGELLDGRIYGRGSSDMKSGVAAFVAAAIELAPHLRGTAGLVLVITADEERGCVGAKHLASMPGALGEAGAAIIAEPTANRVLHGHKGILRVEGIARGITAHSSMPQEGDNAVYKAARIVARLAELSLEGRGSTPGLSPVHNVGWLRGGLNINSVPDEARFGLDFRTVPGFGDDEVMALLAEIGCGEIEFVKQNTGAPVWSDPSGEWIMGVTDIMTAITGERHEPAVAPYFSDASPLSAAYGGPPTLILGPGEPQMAHQTDEYCLVARLEQGAAAFVEIMRRWCGI
jgi:succinyl-diaminopimelate desuccinylase